MVLPLFFLFEFSDLCYFASFGVAHLRGLGRVLDTIIHNKIMQLDLLKKETLPVGVITIFMFPEWGLSPNSFQAVTATLNVLFHAKFKVQNASVVFTLVGSCSVVLTCQKYTV